MVDDDSASISQYNVQPILYMVFTYQCKGIIIDGRFYRAAESDNSINIMSLLERKEVIGHTQYSYILYIN